MNARKIEVEVSLDEASAIYSGFQGHLLVCHMTGVSQPSCFLRGPRSVVETAREWYQTHLKEVSK